MVTITESAQEYLKELPSNVVYENLTTKQIDELLRFEMGTWMKIWVRNATMNWADAVFKDDKTEHCMKTMMLIDDINKSCFS